MADPRYDISHLPPVEGLEFLGHSEGWDVYFVPHPETGLHAITIVGGSEDWNWDSCLIGFIRRSISKGDRRYSTGPWALGVVESDARGLKGRDLNAVLASVGIGGPVSHQTA
jgi:hypothetical protein